MDGNTRRPLLRSSEALKEEEVCGGALRHTGLCEAETG